MIGCTSVWQEDCIGWKVNQYKGGKNLWNEVNLSKIMDKKTKGQFNSTRWCVMNIKIATVPKSKLHSSIGSVLYVYQSALCSKKMSVLYVSNFKDSTKIRRVHCHQRTDKRWQKQSCYCVTWIFWQCCCIKKGAQVMFSLTSRLHAHEHAYLN
jgi:hypothetical protein